MTGKEIAELKELYNAVCDADCVSSWLGGPLRRGIGNDCHKTFGPRGEILIEWGTPAIGSFVAKIYNELPRILKILEENDK